MEPDENMTTFVTETIIKALNDAGLEVKVVSEFNVNKDVELKIMKI